MAHFAPAMCQLPPSHTGFQQARGGRRRRDLHTDFRMENNQRLTTAKILTESRSSSNVHARSFSQLIRKRSMKDRCEKTMEAESVWRNPEPCSDRSAV